MGAGGGQVTSKPIPASNAEWDGATLGKCITLANVPGRPGLRLPSAEVLTLDTSANCSSTNSINYIATISL